MACASIDVPSLIVSCFSFLVSAGALGLVVYDRRPTLLARHREGKWVVWEDNDLNPNEKILRGVMELYNKSTRANTIASYSFRARIKSGESVSLFSEPYEFTEERNGQVVWSRAHNVSPLNIAPYTGIEVAFSCFVPRNVASECVEITATVVDIHKNPYTMKVWEKTVK